VKKNVAGQVVGAQLNSRTDGSPVTTGATSVYITGNGGTQTLGAGGAGSPSGFATHEGNGTWSYTPTQAETNYDHVMFTFVNSAAVLAMVQIYPSFPQTGDSFARLGAPAGASVSADIATVSTNLGSPSSMTAIQGIEDIRTRVPSALVGGRMDSSVGAVANNAITAAAIATDAIDADAIAANAVTEIQNGLATATAVSLVSLEATGANANAALVVNRLGVPTGVDFAEDFQAIRAVTEKLDDTLQQDGGSPLRWQFTAGALELAPTGGSAPTASQIADEVETRTIAAVTLVNGLAANTVTAAALAADAVSEIQSGLSTLDAAGVRSAIGLASANLDTQLDALPTAAENADAVWDEARSGHTTSGSFGQGVASVQGNVTGSTASVTGAVGSVTGNVGGNVTGSVGSIAAGGIASTSFAAGAINAAALAADAITAAKVAADVTTEIQSGLATAVAVAALPTAAENVAELMDTVVDGTLTVAESLRLQNAAAGGKTSGMSTGSPVFRDPDDTKDRITATVDGSKNRTAVTLDLTP
jgi:hypothetical protein